MHSKIIMFFMNNIMVIGKKSEESRSVAIIIGTKNIIYDYINQRKSTRKAILGMNEEKILCTMQLQQLLQMNTIIYRESYTFHACAVFTMVFSPSMALLSAGALVSLFCVVTVALFPASSSWPDMSSSDWLRLRLLGVSDTPLGLTSPRLSLGAFD